MTEIEEAIDVFVRPSWKGGAVSFLFGVASWFVIEAWWAAIDTSHSVMHGLPILAFLLMLALPVSFIYARRARAIQLGQARVALAGGTGAIWLQEKLEERARVLRRAGWLAPLVVFAGAGALFVQRNPGTGLRFTLGFLATMAFALGVVFASRLELRRLQRRLAPHVTSSLTSPIA